MRIYAIPAAALTVALAGCHDVTGPREPIRPSFVVDEGGHGHPGAGRTSKPEGACTLQGSSQSTECGWKLLGLGLTGAAEVFCKRGGIGGCAAGAAAVTDRYHDWQQTPDPWWLGPYVEGPSPHSAFDPTPGIPSVPIGGLWH